MFMLPKKNIVENYHDFRVNLKNIYWEDVMAVSTVALKKSVQVSLVVFADRDIPDPNDYFAAPHRFNGVDRQNIKRVSLINSILPKRTIYTPLGSAFHVNHLTAGAQIRLSTRSYFLLALPTAFLNRKSINSFSE